MRPGINERGSSPSLSTLPIGAATGPLGPRTIGVDDPAPIVKRHPCHAGWEKAGLKTRISEGTRGVYLDAVEQLYQSVIGQTGEDCLDSMLTYGEFSAIEHSLTGFFCSLRNKSAIDGANRTATWRYALMFVQDVMRHIEHDLGKQSKGISANLLRLDALYSQIASPRSKATAPIRALPAVVVEELYRLFNPKSENNPFRTPGLRWRNFLIFILLLHLGLRKGEVLILPVNAVKDEFDSVSNENRFWIDVDSTQDSDPRHHAPSLKTRGARRQLPISSAIVSLSDRVGTNHRFKAKHPYLLSSQQGKPLSTRSVGSLFEQITARLSDRASKALCDRGKRQITPHDLRHTCAVYRLA